MVNVRIVSCENLSLDRVPGFQKKEEIKYLQCTIYAEEWRMSIEYGAEKIEKSTTAKFTPVEWGWEEQQKGEYGKENAWGLT